jgi:hypothetical protein
MCSQLLSLRPVQRPLRQHPPIAFQRPVLLYSLLWFRLLLLLCFQLELSLCCQIAPPPSPRIAAQVQPQLAPRLPPQVRSFQPPPRSSSPPSSRRPTRGRDPTTDIAQRGLGLGRPRTREWHCVPTSLCPLQPFRGHRFTGSIGHHQNPLTAPPPLDFRLGLPSIRGPANRRMNTNSEEA